MDVREVLGFGRLVIAESDGDEDDEVEKRNWEGSEGVLIEF